MAINILSLPNVKETIQNLINEKGCTKGLENQPAFIRCGVGLDSESTTISHVEVEKGKKKDKQKTVVDTCFNYAYQFAISKNYYAICRTIREMLTFLRYIVESVKTFNENNDTESRLIIWCANLSHEWSFIKKAIFEHFNITKMFAKSPRDILYIQLENVVEFRECIGLFGHSLNDIAKHWCSKNNQKLTGTFDYNKIRTFKTHLTNEELAYMIHDVTTLAEMHENVIKYYTQENGVCVLPYTSSGFVRMKLKEAIRNDEYLTGCRERVNETRRKPFKTNIECLKYINQKLVVDDFQWFICREFSYSGGLCGSNIDYVGKILNNVVCADLTSDYPAQFSHCKYPFGKLVKCSGNLNDIREQLEHDKKPYFAILKISKIHAKTKHAIFSQHKIINLKSDLYADHGAPRDLVIYNGKIFSGKNLIVCWNDVDIKAYQECYDFKAGVLTLWAFEKYAPAPAWLLNTMWKDYETKSILKLNKKTETQEYSDSKRDVNSYYGVCAQRVTELFDSFDESLNFTTSKEKTFSEIKRDFWLNPYFAFWCTSYARSILIHFISKYPDAIVQYDTDSLYYIKDKGEELEKALIEYNNNIRLKNERVFRKNKNRELFMSLGEWDFDDIYVKFMGLGAKKYMKQKVDGKIITVIAGLPKSAIPKEIEERGIAKPFNYYNPLVKWLKTQTNDIVIRHAFAGKLASVYNDDMSRKFKQITDYNGVTVLQECGSYHALIPIDFTLSLAIDYIKNILRNELIIDD